VKKLEKYPDLPAAVRHDLFVAKQKNEPMPSRLDRVVEAIKKVAQLHATPAHDGKSVAALAESHPNVLRAITDAAKREE
jgi:hypothetical protein